jgi:Flp pilus assembly protein TadD
MLVGLLVASLTPAQSRTTAGLERAAELIRTGKTAEAEKQLVAVLASNPSDAGALNLLGTIRAQTGKLDEAEALFLRAARADDTFAGPHMNLAYLYMLERAPDKSIDELRIVARLDPSDMSAADKLARLLLSRGRVAEGIAFLEDLERRSPPAALVSLLGDAYAASGDATKAAAAYGRALERDPVDLSALLGLAAAARRAGDTASAIEYLGRARSAATTSPALVRCGRAAIELGLNEEARASLTKATELEPANAPAWMLLGVAWLRKPDLPEAERALRRAAELRPDDAETRVFLGYVLLKSKKIDEARTTLEPAVAVESPAPEGPYYLALVAQEQRDDARAVELLTRVVDRFPTYAPARTALGISYMRLKDLPHARAALEEAVRLSPGDQLAHFNLAMVYARANEPELARSEMSVVERLKRERDARALEDELAPPPSPR